MAQQVKLKVNDGFFGCFQLDGDHTLVAPIINLSTSKALIAIPKKSLNTVKAGDCVSFLQIVGATNISFDDGIPAKIHWVKKLNNAHYLAAACNFYELADPVRDQIDYFISSERRARGQYS